MKKLTTITLALLLLLGIILRFYKLGALPRGLYLDEPSLGYNSYTILTTAKDQYGQFLPLAFKAFGEYKLAGYIYLSVPFIALFGLNAFSIRILSALSGVVGIIGIYLLTKQLIKNTNQKTELVSIMAASLFALSPWSIQLSRAAFEANLALTAAIFGFWALLKSDYAKHRKYAFLSLALLILSFYTYNSARIVIPLLLLSLLVLIRKTHWSSLSKYFLAFIVLSLPAIVGVIFFGEGARANAVVEWGNKQYMLGPVVGFIEKYFTHFSADFLFFKGDFNLRQSLQEIGVLFLPQLPFLLFGLYKAIKYHTSHTKLLLLWLLISPFPAAVATPVPHALRAIFMLVPLTIFSAIGLVEAIYLFKVKQIRLTTILVILVLFSYSFLTYLHVYYIHYAKKSSWDWNENETLMGEYLVNNYPNASRIIVEGNPRDLIYIQFFNAAQAKATDPSKYFFVEKFSDTRLNSGDVVAIAGWKTAPSQLTNPVELRMSNNDIGYKIGIWRSDDEK